MPEGKKGISLLFERFYQDFNALDETGYPLWLTNLGIVDTTVAHFQQQNGSTKQYAVFLAIQSAWENQKFPTPTKIRLSYLLSSFKASASTEMTDVERTIIEHDALHTEAGKRRFVVAPGIQSDLLAVYHKFNLPLPERHSNPPQQKT